METRILSTARLSFALATAIAALLAALLAAPSAHATILYWDGNNNTAGFGTASGTWAAPTAGTTTAGWSESLAGTDVVLGNSVTTSTSDSLNFGGATGLAAGTITVSGTVDAGSMTYASGSTASTITGGTINLAAAPTITVNNAFQTINSNLTGAASGLTKDGSGTLILLGTNAFSGLLINAGGITVNSDASLGASGAGITFTGSGTLIPGQATALNSTRSITINSGLNVVFGRCENTATFAGSLIGTGSTSSIAMTTALGCQVVFNGSGSTFEGKMTIGGIATAVGRNYRFSFASLADSVAASGRIVFSPTGFNVSAANGSVFEYTGTTNLVLDNRQIEFAAGALNPTLGHQIRRTGTGTLTVNTDLIVNSSVAQTLALKGVNTTGSNTFAGKIGDGSGAAIVSLLKGDAGTWALSGNNTYSGGTTVSGGTLAVNGDQSLATGAVTVNGGTLGGTGTIGGTVTVAAAGNLAPGASAGTLSILGGLNISALSAGTTGKLSFELDALANPNDKLAVTGTLTIGVGALGFSDFVFSNNHGGLEVTDGTPYKLITSGGITGGNTLNPGDLSGTLPGGLTGTLQITGNDLELVVSSGSPYDTWAGGAPFDADANYDGVKNGLAWLLRAANKDDNANALLPKVSHNAGGLVMTFTCLKVAKRGTAVLNLQYSKDLGLVDLWTAHEAVVPDTAITVGTVVFTVPSTNDNSNLVNLQAEIPASAASPGTSLFGRLNAKDTP